MIRAENVSVLFSRGLLRKKIRALDGFSLTVNKGDIFGLLGPNGAGKSTAMYCFLGLIQPDSGTVSVTGQKPLPGSKLFREVAYLPEEPHYHMYLTVGEAVGYYAALYGEGISRRKVDEAIGKVGLSEFRNLRLSKCSKGMKQKVGIAQCLVKSPGILFLDEPTRGLDPIAVKELRDVLIEMNKAGATIVLNSHVLSEVEMICNRAAIMNKGRVIAQDELAHLRTFDNEIYVVEMGAADGLPDYADVKIKTADNVKAEIPADRLADFIRFVGETKIKLYECSLKKHSLEETFFEVLKGEKQ